MSQRRMFSPQIVDSDAFLEMPSSAQSLYFHLGMRADDDGFVGNPRKILRMIGGNEDDLKILLVKRFILTFESGVIVIKHWRINNLIRKDWYKETVYLEEKKQLKVKENGSYTENLVNENETVRTRSLGKVSLGKVSLGKDIEREEVATLPTPAEEARSFFEGEFEPILKEFIERSNAPPQSLRDEFSKFILYWTERTKTGTKQRWETEKTFEIRRRLVTWLGNVKSFNSKRETKIL